jgi:hypothetical protein
VAARGANSGEATGGDGRRGVDTDGTGTKLTSWRSSGRAPRRCSGGDGEGPRRRRGLGFRRLWWRLRTGKAARVRGVLGAALLIKARAVSLACGPREDVVLQPDSGDGGGGVRGGDERCGRDDGRGPRVSDPGRRRREAAGGLVGFSAKRLQTKIEFKPEFEFQQTKEMHQHECNN